MAPASSKEDKGVKFVFLANNVSHKFEEMKNDANVNVAFINPINGIWEFSSFRIAGKVKLSNDRNDVKKYWSTGTGAWFGDLKDGVHTGDYNDPRVSMIEVIPDEIRYWYPTEGKVMRAVEIGIDSLTGEVASPGELRSLSHKECFLSEAYKIDLANFDEVRSFRVKLRISDMWPSPVSIHFNYTSAFTVTRTNIAATILVINYRVCRPAFAKACDHGC
ncbi:hypothetical protein NP233_g12326 [Leucocoprinus birnbaumii]|uniref:General stress protein FMN-binding split barrel domain-containing protein n=1 Tax=Leucocoprinus birnbaumii TaxID=56174 RepID=A0AAD5YKI4_9AGAR|nr:hypothetical protein NP233_g12326 [Leucocoprinus birnbaumii]